MRKRCNDGLKICSGQKRGFVKFVLIVAIVTLRNPEGTDLAKGEIFPSGVSEDQNRAKTSLTIGPKFVGRPETRLQMNPGLLGMYL